MTLDNDLHFYNTFSEGGPNLMGLIIMSHKEFINMQIKLFHELFRVVRFHPSVGCCQFVSPKGKFFKQKEAWRMWALDVHNHIRHFEGYNF